MNTQPEENLTFEEDGLFAEEETRGDTPPVTDHRWRILIVDDEEDIHQATRFAFALNNRYQLPQISTIIF